MTRGRRLAIALGTPLLGLAALAALPRRIDLIVLNPLDAAAQVSIDGAATFTDVPGHGQVRLEGAPAALRLVARAGDVELQRASAECPVAWLSARPTWVYTVAPITSWWIVSKGYGDQTSAAPPARPWQPDSFLFELPPDVLPIVDAPLPDQAQVPSGVAGAVRSAVWSGDYVARTAPLLVDLVVDNSDQRTLRVEVDGQVRGTVERWRTLVVLGLVPGAHALRAVELGPNGEEGRVFTAGVETAALPHAPRPRWVWNVGRATPRYWVISRRYGPAPDGAAPPALRTLEPEGEVFRVPDGFFPGVNEPLPERWGRPGVLEGLWSEARLREDRFDPGGFGGVALPGGGAR